MRFYQFSGHCQSGEPDRFGRTPEGRKAQKEANRALSLHCDSFNRSLKGRAFFFPVSMAGTLVAGVVQLSETDLDAAAARFPAALGTDVSDPVTEEITLMQWYKLLRLAGRNEFADEDALLKRLGLDRLLPEALLNFGENLLSGKSRAEIFGKADGLFMKNSLRAELDRIYAGKKLKAASGHPVHYLVRTDDSETRRETCRTLLEALYANGRIRNRRYCFVDLSPHSVFSPGEYDCLCRSCEGGAILVRLATCEPREGNSAGGGRYLLEKLCESMKSCCDSVLTVFCLPRECTEARAALLENLGSTALVELSEDAATEEDAKKYLSALCRKKGLRADGKLWAVLDGGGPFLAPALKESFDVWYNDKLRRSVYPQYRELSPARKEIAGEAPKGSAYDELMGMVGLAEAKKVIDRLLAFHKAQALFAERGLCPGRPSMHMVFTGNPGTAKTSAARLFARILRENGLLSKGTLVEVGRGDLVGRYVGWTAPAIQKKFREAEGGVLFIDEAYSLLDDRDGSFGDEAINTIVQEMENHRSDVVVIFAGYPDKMERFLAKNPGLRSRIAWHVPFADYSPDELCSIAELIAGQKGLGLTDGAREKLNAILKDAARQTDFGNGRYVRNLIEHAEMAQAVRLLETGYDRVGPEELRTIRGEDIEFPAGEKPAEKPKIGFSAD